jgi:hypothetical protein
LPKNGKEFGSLSCSSSSPRIILISVIKARLKRVDRQQAGKAKMGAKKK